MSALLRTHRMSQDAFFAWAEQQDLRYEYDGEGPVLMTGGNNVHSLVNQNIYRALNARLAGTSFKVLGPDAGLATVGTTIRYPDAIVTGAKIPERAHSVPGVLVAFETLSPTSGRMDRTTKVDEYRAVATLRHYVILDNERPHLTVLNRLDSGSDWSKVQRRGGEMLDLPELGISVAVDEFYDGVAFEP